MVPPKCLICQAKIEPDLENETEVDNESCIQADIFNKGGDDPRYTDKKLSQANNKIEKQLHVIFILRNVLELPRETLEKYLKLGGNPEGWISICGICSKEIDYVKRIFEELQNISRKYEEAKEALQEKMKISFQFFPYTVRERKEILPVREDFGNLVKQQSPKPSRTSFIQQDQLANQLARETVAKSQPDCISSSSSSLPQNVKGHIMEVDAINGGDITKVDSIHDPDGCEDLALNLELNNSDGDYEPELGVEEAESNQDDNDSGDKPSYQLRRKRKRKRIFTKVLVKSKSRSRTTPKKIKVKKELDSEDDSQKQADGPSACDHCGEQCADPKSLRTHKRFNHAGLEEKDELTCNVCKLSFPTLSHLHCHLKITEAHKDQKCQICGKQESCNGYLKKHLRKEHGIPRFDCTYKGCSKFYHRKRDLKRHMDAHPREMKCLCDICGRELSREDALINHKFIVHKVGKGKRKTFHECKDCGFRCFLEDAFTTHKRVCSKRMVFECQICVIKCTSKLELATHLKYKHSITPETEASPSEVEPEANPDAIDEPGVEETYPCPHCGKLFITRHSLSQHEKAIHEKAGRFTCDVANCGYGASSRSTYDVHRARMHQIGIENYKCDKCQHFCISLAEKERHVCGVVEKRRKHVCTICGYESFRSKELANHILNVHEKKFRLNCHLCESFGANVKCDLKAHLASKHGIGDWKCEEEGCSKVFHRQKLLENHVKYNHKGEARPKNKICPECGTAFALATVLTAHIQIMHSDAKPYKCQWCGEAFKTSSYRSLHKRKCALKKQEEK